MGFFKWFRREPKKHWYLVSFIVQVRNYGIRFETAYHWTKDKKFTSVGLMEAQRCWGMSPGYEPFSVSYLGYMSSKEFGYYNSCSTPYSQSFDFIFNEKGIIEGVQLTQEHYKKMDPNKSREREDGPGHVTITKDENGEGVYL